MGAGKAQIELSFDAWKDGRVAPASVEVPVALLDVKDSPQLRATLRGHTARITALDFAPDGKTLASCTYLGELKLWDVVAAKEKRALSQSEKFVPRLAYLHDGKTLAMAWSEPFGKDGRTLIGSYTGREVKGYRGGIQLWDTTTGKECGNLHRRSPRGVNYIALSSDGKTLAAREFWRENDGKDSKDNIALWEVASGNILRDLDIKDPGSMVFTPDGKTLAVNNGEGVLLFDVSTGQKRVKLGTSSPFAIAFSPDGKTLVGCHSKGTICIWDVASGVEKARLRHGRSGKTCSLALAFSPDGRTLAVGLGPGNVYVVEPSEIVLWDVETHQKRLTLHGHVGDIWALAFNKDGTLLASGGVDNTVKLWDMASPSASKR